MIGENTHLKKKHVIEENQVSRALVSLVRDSMGQHSKAPSVTSDGPNRTSKIMTAKHLDWILQ